MELYPQEAITTNVLGTYNIIRESRKYECLEKFVFISTDKAVGSNSIMGATKRLGEIMVKNQGKGFVVVRFGNVLGSRGSLIPIWQKQFDGGEPLTVTDSNVERYFMTIPEACELVIRASKEGNGGEIFILDMGKRVNILDLATKIANETRSEIKITALRDGETLTEKIMFEEEEKRAIKKDKFFIVK
jgi:FlaA1/EpsC-like NDP-sugar epimerase